MMEILVCSCDAYWPLWGVFTACWRTHWPQCPYRIRIMSHGMVVDGIDTLDVGEDIGWNDSLIKALQQIESEFVMLVLDDMFLEPQERDHTTAIENTLGLFYEHSHIGAIKIGAGWSVVDDWSGSDIFGIFDRQPHPFKRTTLLSATIYRKEFLVRICTSVLDEIKRSGATDVGRAGAIEFEMTGTRLTKDGCFFPESFLQIKRIPNQPAGLLVFYNNDAVHERKLTLGATDRNSIEKALGKKVEDFPGMSIFL